MKVPEDKTPYVGRCGQPVYDHDGRFKPGDDVMVDTDSGSLPGTWQQPDEDGNMGYYNVLVEGQVLTMTAARIHVAEMTP